MDSGIHNIGQEINGSGKTQQNKEAEKLESEHISSILVRCIEDIEKQACCWSCARIPERASGIRST